MRRLLVVSLVVCSAPASAQKRPGDVGPTRTEIAPGIHLFATPPYGDVGLDGNSIAVLSSEGVLVFDSNGTPAASAAILAEIRQLTDKPVKYVVNSHWHWDHWYGTQTYQDAFPGVQIITHKKNRDMMLGPAAEFNRPGLETQLPAYIQSLEKRAASDARLAPLVEQDRFFLDQKKNARLVPANITFTDRLDIDLAERHVEVLNYGRGVTPGDTFVYLPREKVLLLGDLIVNPITFALSGYPTEWLHVLERIDRLDASIIVTGHGAALRDKSLLHATMAVFRVLLREGKASKENGLTADQAKEAIMPALHDLMTQMTGGDPGRNAAFKQQLVDWYLHRVYDELDGPLSDAIAPIPPS
jgi:glyoxylase-like metal-dependent hydrolase (beta-lactamase superfamily II)